MIPTPPATILITSAGSPGGMWRELWAARDLWRFLVWRDLKARYSQSVLGLGWAIVQPLFTMGVFTLVFGRLGGSLSGDARYDATFSLAAVVPWTFFSGAAGDAANCLAANMGMVTKIYFPRLILPLAAVTAKLLDLAIMLVLLGVVVVMNGHVPSPASLFAIPLALLVVFFDALGLGLWLAALSVRYRDVRYAQSYFLQLLLWASPVAYATAKVVPVAWQNIYALNPLAGAIDTIRAVLIQNGPIPWDRLAIGAISALVLCATGVWCFRRTESVLADIA